MPESGHRDSLLAAAQAYHAKGYAVIPLHGAADPTRAKVAAVAWKGYQQRKPTPAELREWFVDNGYPALALITGRISGLVVLDLDSQRAYDLFRQACPDLVQQHVVKSPRGWHIHFHLPPHLSTTSRKVPEADWLAEGCYVVARPTPGYRLITGGEPKRLDQYDLNRITAFLDLLARTVPTGETWVTTVNPLPVSGHTLASQYRYLAPQIGRNEALFRLSLKARDHGWTLDDTITALAGLHARQPATGDHAHESATQRRKEAVATIVSAFSRPPRPVQTQQGRGLSVSVVEALYAQGLTCVVRVMNELRERGLDAGAPVSYTQARRLLRGSRVGKWSLLKALRARLPDGQPVFPPSGLPLAPDGAAADRPPADHQLNAYLIGRQNRNKVPAHRPQTYVTMPSDAELCQRLGVPLTRPDPMTAADRASARGTRLASLRELVARRPEQYPNQWQARRLGVSKRTLQRYKHLIPDLQVTPVYVETRLYWGNLTVLPDDDTFKGAFLQDETGKKYPPIAGIAAKLLKQGRAVHYRRQAASHYCLNTPPVAACQPFAPVSPLVLHPPPPARRVAVAPSTRMDNGYPPLPAADYQPALPGFVPFRAAPRLPQAAAPPRQRRSLYHKPLPDAEQEALAQRVYDTINARTAEKAHSISLVSARKYVATYGLPAVERALRLLSRRQNVYKPVGFFATLLRCKAPFRPRA